MADEEKVTDLSEIEKFWHLKEKEVIQSLSHSVTLVPGPETS